MTATTDAAQPGIKSSAAKRSAHASASLVDMVKRRASREDIAALLDGLRPGERLEEVQSIAGPLVGRLYDCVGGAETLTLDDFVPAAERGTVIFEGKNSLPAFSHFQKRFARVGTASPPSGDRGVVVGYNHQTMSLLTGPGYFTVQPPTPGEAHPDELYLDYTTEPTGFPAGWPPYKPNSAGLSRAVFMNMKDFCRRVAKGVLVGKAYKLGVSQGAYFTLTRPH